MTSKIQLTAIALFLAAAGLLQGQQVVAPTPDQPGKPRGENFGDYNITNSFETGYRWSQVGGDQGMYRANVNYGNGIRLLGSDLTVNSKDGHGRFFDEILIHTSGLGNDPYQFASMRIQKNGWYRYDGSWRLSDYYNPGYVIAGGAHLSDTERRLQDHELRLLPLKHFEFRLGYSRNDERGPGLTTEQGLNNQETLILPIYRDLRREWNEYRVGGDVDLLGFKLTIMRQWDFYKDDSYYNPALGGVAGVIGNEIRASRYAHAEPLRGRTPGWLGNLNTARKYWALNARATYVMGHGAFALNELGTAPGRNGAVSNFQTVVGGNARRPVMAADLSLSIFPTSKLTLVLNSSQQSNRIDGNATIAASNPFGVATSLAFQYLSIRTIATSFDAQYRFTNWFGVFAAYEYSTRLIRSLETETFVGGGFGGGGGGGQLPPGVTPPAGGGGFPPPAAAAGDAIEEQNNHLNIGRFGFAVKPIKPVTVRLETEVGRDNHPFLPLNDRDYHSINGRIDYRVKRLRLGAGYRQHYNVNSPSVTSFHSSRARTYSANASFNVIRSFSLDANYTKLHLDTAGSLAFFYGAGRANALYRNYSSYYFSNIHSVNLGGRVDIRKRATLFLGYNLTKDLGDGRPSAIPSGVTDPIAQLVDTVQTFPLSYQAPLARLSIKLATRIQWNVGWQLFNYKQAFLVLGHLPNYHANTGFTSLSWSF